MTPIVVIFAIKITIGIIVWSFVALSDNDIHK